jgi:hypothetical protein
MMARLYSFQKLDQFSQWNKVLNALPFNIHGFPLRYTCVSSIQLSRPTWKKMSVTLPWNPDWQAVFLLKTHLILTRKQGAICFFFYLRQFSFERYMHFFNSAEYVYLEKMSVIPPWNPDWQAEFLAKKLQFSHRDNVLDDPASNKDGFL